MKGTFKYMFKKIIGALASIIGELLFLCVYWLFRLDTGQNEEDLYRRLIFLALILIKILSFSMMNRRQEKTVKCLTSCWMSNFESLLC